MHKQDMLIHAMKYASKKKEILIHATRCVNLEDIMVSEISQLQKDKYYMIPLMRLSRVIKEKAMATHSSTLAWKIPWMEEPGRLQSMGSLRVGHD